MDSHRCVNQANHHVSYFPCVSVSPQLMDSYTVETQMLPTLAAITMSIQYSVDTHTLMAFLYM